MTKKRTNSSVVSIMDEDNMMNDDLQDIDEESLDSNKIILSSISLLS